ncbi:MAG: hypothetical protein COW16_10420 [Sphingomonadales bacterium CG12_big_fil_rev_8_21_14_0_65_65_10]|nr:MAG: hypothetical protein COW16_10420 [Sphingomonadales bacterium CG12_big_fil_rev_8_21_14_0_65_65_10]
MPVFADLAAMQARFEDRDLLELSDQDNSGVIDADRIDAAIESADNLIRSYIASRHKDVATLAGNELLTDIACDLAFARLFRSDPPDWVMTRKKDAEARLQKIADGKIKLDGGSEEQPARPGQILTHSDRPKFGRDNLGSY